MHWADHYIGLPHEKLGRGPEAYDCLGLAILVQGEVFGREIEDPMCSFTQAMRPRERALLQKQVAEVPAADVQAGDALLFFEAGRALHIGTVICAQLMLHSHRVTSCVENWKSPRWRGKLQGAYRFV